MQKQFRLKSRKSFSVIYNRGKSVSNKYLVLMWLDRWDSQIKVGFTVSKKVGNSVTRNYVRRRLKEAFRHLIIDIKNGNTYVVLARAPIVDIDYHKISESLKDLLIKAKCLESKE